VPITREETPFGPGDTGASAPNVPGIPTFSANGSGTITIALDANGNDAVVTFVIRVKHDVGAGYAVKGYVQADGSVGAGEIAQTLAVWGATKTITGLTDFIPYTVAAKAINELAVESAYCSESAVMNTLPNADYGVNWPNYARKVSGGNTIVDETTGLVISGTQVTAAEATQTVLPEYYGIITVTYKLKNNSSTASRIVVQFSEDGTTWATATKGTGGDAITGLTTSAAGTTHTFNWDSYTDSGTSELDTSVYLRITPYDATPTGGDAAATVTSAAFAVNNRPAISAWESEDGFVFDKDTTPTFRAIIPNLRGGTQGFPEISIYRTTGMTLVALYQSITSIAGWEYETAPSTWVAMAVTGIPSSAIDGVNRLRYTPTAALTADDYTINGRMGEWRDLS
jgi:hypothetical protein